MLYKICFKFYFSQKLKISEMKRLRYAGRAFNANLTDIPQRIVIDKKYILMTVMHAQLACFGFGYKV